MHEEKSTSRGGSGTSLPTANNQSRKKEKPPFKLCFKKEQECGRSDVCSCRATAKVLTPKFYSREAENSEVSDNEIGRTVTQIAEEEQRTPRKVYRWPHLTSHTYGWWHDRGIRPMDPRFNFHKKTSDMVSYQMKIYADDRKLKGMSH